MTFIEVLIISILISALLAIIFYLVLDDQEKQERGTKMIDKLRVLTSCPRWSQDQIHKKINEVIDCVNNYGSRLRKLECSTFSPDKLSDEVLNSCLVARSRGIERLQDRVDVLERKLSHLETPPPPPTPTYCPPKLIKGCPWCGADPAQGSLGSLSPRAAYYFSCVNPKCGAHSSVTGGSFTEAVAKWNRRSEE